VPAAAAILALLMFRALAQTPAMNATNSDPLPSAKPETVGMSSERLGEIANVIKADVDKGRLPGAVIAIARRGRLVYYEAFGFRDKAAGVAMTKDTIFNIASMIKPMATVAALQLVERGKLLIDDPLAKYFPKFAEMQGLIPISS
jgi:CubicO group peptidase (beta-lactamase class C family)